MIDLKPRTPGSSLIFDDYSVTCKTCGEITKNIIMPNVCKSAMKWHTEKNPTHTEFEIRGWYKTSEVIQIDDLQRIDDYENKAG